MKIYIAGPFSKPEEREALKHMIEIVKTRFPYAELYIPMEYKVPGDFQHEDGTWHLPNIEWAKAVYTNDIKELEQADMVIAMYGGHYCTSGTVWEIGYASGLGGKDVFIYIPHYCREGSDLSLMVTMGADGVLQDDGNIEFWTKKVFEKYNLK